MGVTSSDGCVDVMIHRRHLADDEKGLLETLDDRSTPVTRLWASGEHGRFGEGATSGGGAGKSEAERGSRLEEEGDTSWAQRQANELRFPLQTFAIPLRQGDGVDASRVASEASSPGNQGGGGEQGLQRWRRILQQEGLIWEYSPLAQPLPAGLHIEAFPSDDGPQASSTEEADLTQGGEVPAGGTETMWVRNMAETRNCEEGESGGKTKSDGKGENVHAEAVAFDLSSALQLPRLAPVNIEGGDLKAICIL